MGDITTNFSYYEVAKGYKIDEITLSVKNNLISLVKNVLQPAREKLAEPIHITSGYRNPAHNKAVGGATNSQHLYGEAADIYCSKTGKEFFLYMLDNFHDVIGGIGLYADENSAGKFIHVDIRPKVNGAVTTWYFNGSEYVYLPISVQNTLKAKKIKFI